MPGCSSPPVISASSTKRPRLSAVVGVAALDLLQGDLAAQFGVLGDEHLAQPAAGVRPQDAVAAGRRRGRPGVDERAGRPRLRRRAGAATCLSVCLHVGVGERRQRPVQGRLDRRQRRQALLRVVAVLLEVFLDQGVEQLQPGRRQVAVVAQEVAERLGLVEQPGVHAGDQGVAGDEVELHGQDAEQQVAVGGHGAGLWRTECGCGHCPRPATEGKKKTVPAAAQSGPRGTPSRSSKREHRVCGNHNRD